MKGLVIYVHGKNGSAEEAKHYEPLFPDCDVVGLDYKAKNPWEAREEFSGCYDILSEGYDSVTLIANSIGAYLSMSALSEKTITLALFISPVVDLEEVIRAMMARAGLTESELRRRKEVTTDSGDTLSWDYLCRVRESPVRWKTPTYILYGDKDEITPPEIMTKETPVTQIP